jgi:hypothetical protein
VDFYLRKIMKESSEEYQTFQMNFNNYYIFPSIIINGYYAKGSDGNSITLTGC